MNALELFVLRLLVGAVVSPPHVLPIAAALARRDFMRAYCYLEGLS